MRMFWSVALGAAIGGVSRFYLTGFIQQRAGLDFPAGTWVINVTGSFLLGLFMRYGLQSVAISVEMRALLTTGFCGGFTTFSTFSYENALMIQDGRYGRVAVYIVTSVAVSLAATFLGFGAANRLLAFREALS